MRKGALAVGLSIAAILALVPAASAGTSIRHTLRQIKSLQRTDAALLGEVTALQVKAAELEEHEPAPTSLAVGAASGDLVGAYPDPRLAPNTIFGANILDRTLLGSDFGAGSVNAFNLADQAFGSAGIADGAIGRTKFAGPVIGALQLSGTHTVVGVGGLLGSHQQGASTAACPPGETLLYGGWAWHAPNESNHLVLSSAVDPSNPNQWKVAGRNDGNFDQLIPYALCLR